jgi:hypothetical protein
VHNMAYRQRVLGCAVVGVAALGCALRRELSGELLCSSAIHLYAGGKEWWPVMYQSPATGRDDT